MKMNKQIQNRAFFQDARISRSKRSNAARILATSLAVSVAVANPLLNVIAAPPESPDESTPQYLLETTDPESESTDPGSLMPTTNPFEAKEGDLLYYSLNGVVFKVVVEKPGKYSLPTGATVTTEAEYNAYIESLAAAAGAIELKPGTYFFRDVENRVFMFVVSEEGWYDLDGATQVDREAYDLYIASLAIKDGGIYLDEGTHFFAKDDTVFVFNADETGWYDLAGAELVDEAAYIAYIEGLRAADTSSLNLQPGVYYFEAADGSVFMFAVGEAGWYNLGGATQVDEAAYNDYIESLATTAGGIDLAEGVHYFRLPDGSVIMFEVADAGWYDLKGAVIVDEAAYIAYIEGLRTADEQSIELATGTYFFELPSGAVIMFEVNEAGWFNLESATQVDEAAYDAYIASLAIMDGGIDLGEGTFYFEMTDGSVFVFEVSTAGWYNLGGSVQVGEAAYQAYIESLRASDAESIELAAGMHYFRMADGSVFMFEVETEGWYNLEGAVQVDEAAYDTYIEGLRAADEQSVHLAAGTHFFLLDDGSVFMFFVANAGWFNLNGLVQTDEAAYNAYIEGLATDAGGIELTVGAHYFLKADGSVFMFNVTNAGWYDLNGAKTSDEAAYNKYIEGLRAADPASVELAAGTYYFAKGGKVFMFTVTEPGWFNLNGATPTNEAAYTAYINDLRAADVQSIELAEGKHYFAKDNKVFLFTVTEAGWFNLGGAVQVDETAYNAYIESLAEADDGIELAGGTYYFRLPDNSVIVFTVTEAGWYDLAGAEQVDEAAYTAYIEGLRATDEQSIKLAEGLHYFAKDGKVFVFNVTAEGWYNLGGATRSSEAAYKAYIEDLATAAGGIALAAGTHYFMLPDETVFMFIVENAGWYDLGEAVLVDDAAYETYVKRLREEDPESVKLDKGDYYFAKDGKVFIFAVAEAGWYNLEGATQVDEAAYNAYIESLATDVGGIELAVGTHYFMLPDGSVFMFEVTIAGWFNLGGATQVNEAAYDAYIEGLRAIDPESIELAAGTHYFLMPGDSVIVFTVTEAGWYNLEGATQVDEAVYNAYIESLATGAGGIELAVGKHYFEMPDGSVFMFIVENAGWYNLSGMKEVDEAAYDAYIEGLRDDDKDSIELAAGTHYFLMSDDSVIVFTVVKAGWFNLEGATQVNEAAYNAYIESLATVAGGIELTVGTHYFEKIDGSVFMFEVTNAGWYNLNGASEVDEAAYAAYIEGLRDADEQSVYLETGAYYFLLPDKSVIMFGVTEAGWYDLVGAKQVSEAVYNAYIEGLASVAGGIKLAVGTHYFEKSDGSVFMFEVTNAGWYDLGGATQVDYDAYDAYVKHLREEDNESIELEEGTYYFILSDGTVIMFIAEEAGWYNLDGAIQTVESEYIKYINSLATATGGIELNEGANYFEMPDGSVFMFEVAEAGWYDLGEAVRVSVDEYNKYVASLAIAQGAFYLNSGDAYYYELDGVVYKVDAEGSGWYKIPVSAAISDKDAYDSAIAAHLAALETYWEDLLNDNPELGLLPWGDYDSPDAAYAAAQAAIKSMNDAAKEVFETAIDAWWENVLEKFPGAGLYESWKDYSDSDEAAVAANSAAESANAEAYAAYVASLRAVWTELIKQYGDYLAPEFHNLDDFLNEFEGNLGQIVIIINTAREDKKIDVEAQRPPMPNVNQAGTIRASAPAIQSGPPANIQTPSGSSIDFGNGITAEYKSNTLTIKVTGNSFELGIYDFYFRSGGTWFHVLFEVTGAGTFTITGQAFSVGNGGAQAIGGDRATNDRELAELPPPPVPVGVADPIEKPVYIAPADPLPVGNFDDGALLAYILAEYTDILGGFDFKGNPGDLLAYILAEYKDELDDFDLKGNLGDLINYVLATNPDVLAGYTLSSNPGGLIDYILAEYKDILGEFTLSNNPGGLIGYILAEYKDILGEFYLSSNPGGLIDYILAENKDILGGFTLSTNPGGLLEYILATNPDVLAGYTLGSNPGDLVNYILATNPDVLAGYIMNGNFNELIEFTLATNPDVLAGYILSSNLSELIEYILTTNPDVLAGYTLGSNLGELIDYILATNPDVLGGFVLGENPGDLLAYILATNPDILDGFELGSNFQDLLAYILATNPGSLVEYITKKPVTNVPLTPADQPETEFDPVQTHISYDELEFEDPDVPLADFEPDVPDETIVEDPETPFSAMPQTGIKDPTTGLFTGLFTSIFGLGAAAILASIERRRLLSKRK